MATYDKPVTGDPVLAIRFLALPVWAQAVTAAKVATATRRLLLSLTDAAAASARPSGPGWHL